MIAARYSVHMWSPSVSTPWSLSQVTIAPHQFPLDAAGLVRLEGCGDEVGDVADTGQAIATCQSRNPGLPSSKNRLPRWVSP